MSKKGWFVLLFILGALGYVIASKIHPPLDVWTHENVTTPLLNGLSALGVSIQASDAYRMYIGPNLHWIFGFGGLVFGWLSYRWISRRHLPWRRKVTKPFTPMSSPTPTVVVQTPAAPVTTPVQPTQQPQPQPQPTPQPEQKPESE